MTGFEIAVWQDDFLLADWFCEPSGTQWLRDLTDRDLAVRTASGWHLDAETLMQAAPSGIDLSALDTGARVRVEAVDPGA